MAAEDSANGLVGAAHAELEQFSLHPTVHPSGCSRESQAQAELAALGGETGASAPGTAGEHRPPAPDEIAMPAQQGLGADQEADPGRAGQASAETCERHTISRPPAWPLDLALEHAYLLPENQELKSETGV